MSRPLLKHEADKLKDKVKGHKSHKGIFYNEEGDSDDNKKIFTVTFPGGHRWRISAKDENDIKKELDKVAK